MAFNYLKFLNDERLKAKEELDSSKLKLNLIMFEQFKEQQSIIHSVFDFRMMAKAAYSCIGVTDDEENTKCKKVLATYISDFFGVKSITVLNAYQYGYDARCYSIRFTAGKEKACYELEIPNLNATYWNRDEAPSKIKTDDILDMLYYMNVRLRSVKGSEKCSVCDEICAYLDDADKFRQALTSD